MSKRLRVMQRSKKLGHCICDPGRACPCRIFIEQDICPCAGETPALLKSSQIKLTQDVRNPGCASKIPARELERCLSNLPMVDDPSVISGLPQGDDAGIYKINPKTMLVQTVDIFTPCADDPFIFGKICAANCLSDIYAMGGVPRTALSIMAFPSDKYEGRIMYLMLKGAMETFQEAKCALIGGHSIKDEEVKLGFAITGTIDSRHVVSLARVRAGDKLVLTKPLGTGILNFAGQIGRNHGAGLATAQKSMMTLNKEASEIMLKVGVSACTDITGFGLFGHLKRMVRNSGLSAQIYADVLPAFPGVMELLCDGVIPGAVERNGEFVGKDLSADENVAEEYKDLGLGAETSGGLLISVPAKRSNGLIQGLKSRKMPAAVIGEIKKKNGALIKLVWNKAEPHLKSVGLF